METAVFKIEFTDGRNFRIFCANRTQKQKVLRDFDKLKKEGKVKELTTITNAIYTTAQWHKFLDYENQN